MENKKQEDKELQDIIDEITGTAKDLVNEYVSGEDEFVPEEERAKLNESEIRAPYKDDGEKTPFKVTPEEMECLMKVQTQIKEVFKKDPDIYIQGETERVSVLEYCKKVGPDKFSILEFIGEDKQKLKLCLTIKI